MNPSDRWLKGVSRNPRFGSLLIALLKNYQQSGKKIIALVDGDPVQAGLRNPFLAKHLEQVAKEKWDMYPDNSEWETRLKQAIANFEKNERNLDASPEDILLSPGCAGAFNVLHHTLLAPGDEIVAPDPSHYLTGPISYWSYFEAKPTTYSCKEDNDWEPDLVELRSKISDKTKALVINNPNNPTGAVYNETLLRKMVDIAGEHDLPIISDEIYGLITYDGVKATPVAAVSKDVPTITISGFSKFFMGPGWRIGYILSHDPADKIRELKETMTKVANIYGFSTDGIATPILAATARIYEDKQAYRPGREMTRQLQEQRDFTWKRLNEIASISCVKPRGAFYAFPHVSGIGEQWKNDEEFLIALMKEEQLALGAGSWFGERGCEHLRVVFLENRKILENAFSKLEKFITKHAR